MGIVRSVLLLTAMLLAACAAPPERGTEITRFHMNEPIPPQTVVIVPGEGMQADSIEFNTYKGIIADELRGIALNVVDDEDAALRAQMVVSRELQQIAPKSSGFSIGVGMGSYSNNRSVGGGVSAPVGGRKGGEVFATTMSVTLIDNAENAVVWEGTALNTAESAPGLAVEAVRSMANALFAGFPGESGVTVTVPTTSP